MVFDLRVAMAWLRWPGGPGAAAGRHGAAR